MQHKITLYQNTILPRTFFGIDTVQGLLELAENFGPGVRLCAPESEIKNPDSFYARVSELVKDGYLTSQWTPMVDGTGEPSLELNRLALTVQGHLLLDDIRKRSKLQKFRSRISELLWVVISAIVTSFITVKLIK